MYAPPTAPSADTVSTQQSADGEESRSITIQEAVAALQTALQADRPNSGIAVEETVTAYKHALWLLRKAAQQDPSAQLKTAKQNLYNRISDVMIRIRELSSSSSSSSSSHRGGLAQTDHTKDDDGSGTLVLQIQSQNTEREKIRRGDGGNRSAVDREVPSAVTAEEASVSELKRLLAAAVTRLEEARASNQAATTMAEQSKKLQLVAEERAAYAEQQLVTCQAERDESRAGLSAVTDQLHVAHAAGHRAAARCAYAEGDALFCRGYYEEAVAKFDEAIGCGVSEVQCMAISMRGQAHFQIGDWDMAHRDFSNAHELEPHEPSHLISRAHVAQELQRPQQAVSDFRQALKLAPDHAHASAMLSILQEQLELPAALQRDAFLNHDEKPQVDGVENNIQAIASLDEETFHRFDGVPSGQTSSVPMGSNMTESGSVASPFLQPLRAEGAAAPESSATDTVGQLFARLTGNISAGVSKGEIVEATQKDPVMRRILGLSDVPLSGSQQLFHVINQVLGGNDNRTFQLEEFVDLMQALTYVVKNARRRGELQDDLQSMSQSDGQHGGAHHGSGGDDVEQLPLQPLWSRTAPTNLPNSVSALLTTSQSRRAGADKDHHDHGQAPRGNSDTFVVASDDEEDDAIFEKMLAHTNNSISIIRSRALQAT